MLKHIKLVIFIGALAAGAGGQVRALPADSSQAIADRIVKSKIPVLIDFWAPWCGPCRFVAPTIKQIKKNYAGRLVVMKINVDIHRQIAAYFRITAIPAVFIVKDSKVVKYLPGVQSKKTYIAAVEEVLAMKSKPADAPAPKEQEKQNTEKQRDAEVSE